LTKNRAGVVRTPALFFSIIYPKRVSYAKLRPLSSRALDRPHNFPPLTGAVTANITGAGAIPGKGELPDMREYEVVFIVHPDLEETAFKEIVDRVTGWVSADGGSISKIDIWGKRTLAYPIRKKTEGQYVLLNASILPEKTVEIERNMRLTEPIMRFLVTSRDAQE
jgi:small subunit ribosomal protein S6